MAFALVDNIAGQANAANGAVTFPLGSPAQNNLIVVTAKFALIETSVTDPSGYTRDTFKRTAAGSHSIMILSKIAGAAESATITFTHAAAIYGIEAYNFSGNATASVLDGVAAGAAPGSVATIQPGSLTPGGGATDDLFIACATPVASNGGSEAIDSGFTVVDIATLTQLVTGYKIKTDAAAENPNLSWLTAGQAAAVMAAYKAAAVAAGQPTIKRYTHIPHSIGAHAAGRRI